MESVEIDELGDPAGSRRLSSYVEELSCDNVKPEGNESSPGTLASSEPWDSRSKADVCLHDSDHTSCLFESQDYSSVVHEQGSDLSSPHTLASNDPVSHLVSGNVHIKADIAIHVNDLTSCPSDSQDQIRTSEHPASVSHDGLDHGSDVSSPNTLVSHDPISHFPSDVESRADIHKNGSDPIESQVHLKSSRCLSSISNVVHDQGQGSDVLSPNTLVSHDPISCFPSDAESRADINKHSSNPIESQVHLKASRCLCNISNVVHDQGSDVSSPNALVSHDPVPQSFTAFDPATSNYLPHHVDLTVSDSVICDLANDIPTDEDIDRLVIALRFGRRKMQQVHSSNRLTGSVTSRGTKDMLMEWRQITDGADRAKLKQALQEARLHDLARKYFANVDVQVEARTSCLQSSDAITDQLIDSLASDVEGDDQINRLGQALGSSEASIKRCHATNRMTGSVTYKGVKDLLYEWRSRTDGADAGKLKCALQDAKLIHLAEKYLTDVPSYCPITAGSPDLTVQPAQDTSFLSQKITGKLTAGQLQKKLINHYQSELCHIRLQPWNPESWAGFDTHYVNVELHDQDRTKGTKYSLNDVLEMTTSDKVPFRCAIFAKAGSGKSTMAAKIAYDWTKVIQGEPPDTQRSPPGSLKSSAFGNSKRTLVGRTEESPLRNIQFLFVITMRLLEKGESLGKAILQQILESQDDEAEDDNLADAVQRFIQTNQDKCMLVFDGFDEYIGSIGKESPSNIAKILRNEWLKEVPTTVMSRCQGLRHFCKASLAYAKIEVEGFSEANVNDYIERFFADKQKTGLELRQFLDGCPVADELVRVPLFCVMVCDLWNEKCLKEVKTQTSLFDQVVLYLWHHTQAKVVANDDASCDSGWDEMYDSDSEDNPELKDLLKNLGEVILRCALQDHAKTVFHPKDFAAIQQDLDMGCKMGLLSRKSVAAKRAPRGKATTTTEIQFYHKLAQEHTASKYLSSLVKNNKPDQLKDTLAQINGYGNVRKHENLLRFACGFSNCVALEVLTHILRQEGLKGPLPPCKNAAFRLMLDFLNECSDVDADMTDLLKNLFNDGYLPLYELSPGAILGLKKLPQVLKDQVTFMIRLQSTRLSESMTKEFCEAIAQFRFLKHLGLRGVDAGEATFIEITKTVRRNKTRNGLLLKYCYTDPDGPFDQFVRRLHVPERKGNIKITIFHEDETHRTYHIPHDVGGRR